MLHKCHLSFTFLPYDCVQINMDGSLEDENSLNTIEDKNPEAEEGEFESTLMEHENETIERYIMQYDPNSRFPNKISFFLYHFR